MNRPRLSVLAVLLSLVVAGGGCVVVSDPDGDCRGDINISWSFDTTAACPLTAEDVRVTLLDPSGAPLHSAGGDIFACDKGGTTYTELRCGSGYEVRLEAIDDTGTPTWAVHSQGITVTGNAVTPVGLDLQEL